MNNFLEIHNLSKSFIKGQYVLKDLTHSFEQNDIVAILGENGCGKTTLLKILATLTSQTQGKLKLQNIDYKEIEKKKRSLIGWMPSGNTGFYSKLTGHENILYFASFYKINYIKLTKTIHEWKINPVFQHALNTKFYLCSTGMKNILLLFKAYMHNPRLILLDEPLVSFDLETAEFAISKIKENARDNLTIFTSHQNQDVTNLAASSLTLKGGQFD